MRCWCTYCILLYVEWWDRFTIDQLSRRVHVSNTSAFCWSILRNISHSTLVCLLSKPADRMMLNFCQGLADVGYFLWMVQHTRCSIDVANELRCRMGYKFYTLLNMSTRTGCHLWPTRWNVNKRLAFNRRRCNINHVTLTSRMTSTTAVQYRYVTPLPAWWWRRSRHVTATTVSTNRAVTWLRHTLVPWHSHCRRRHSRLDRRQSSAFRRYFTSLRVCRVFYSCGHHSLWVVIVVWWRYAWIALFLRSRLGISTSWILINKLI